MDATIALVLNLRVQLRSSTLGAILANGVAASAGLLSVILLLVPLGNDYRALWYGEVTDALHVPLFAGLMLVASWLCGPRHPWLAIGLTAGFAAGAEVVQPWFGRSASWRDLAYGILGVAMAGVWLQMSWRLAFRIAITVVLMAWPLSRTVPVTVDAVRAWRSFPILASFDGPFENRRWWLQGATLMPTTSNAARLRFQPSHQGSSAILFPVVRDWSKFATLEFEFEFEGEPLLLLVSIRDGKRLPPELPRYDLWKTYSAGRHHVSIDLRELERGGSFPPIDLKRVQSFHLVVYSDQPRTIAISPIELRGVRHGNR